MKKRNRTRIAAACGLLASLAPASQLSAENESLSEYVLYGINATNNRLVKYDFSDCSYDTVGTVQVQSTPGASGQELDGIEGMAYLPEHLNIFAFWKDQDAQETKLVYISRENGQAAIVGGNFGPGLVTGATVSGVDQASELNQQNVMIRGMVNINPNNNGQFEFEMTAVDGTRVTRDMLLTGEGIDIDANGNAFDGDCVVISFKPKGNGNQNSMIVDGMPYPVSNSETYTCEADPSAPMSVRVWNDNYTGSGGAMGRWWVIFDEVSTNPVTIHEQRGIFAIQNVEAIEDTTIDFEIVGGHVIPTEAFAVKFSVLGAAISAGGSYDIPVTASVLVGTEWDEPWGDYGQAVAGNVNDDNNPRHNVVQEVFPAGTPIATQATSWIKKKYWYSGNKESHWNSYLTVDSATDSPSVLVLRHGDEVPAIAPFLDQDDIVDFIRDFVSTDPTSGTQTVVLDENQAIFLYELGTTELTSSAADFQDLVVLVTLAADPSLLDENDDDDDDANFASRLIKVDPVTAGYEQVMTLNNRYESLAATTDGMFYATMNNQLFRLDPFDQTETFVGNLPNHCFTGFENAGAAFCGFNISDDTLSPLDVNTGEATDSEMSIGASNLRTIVFAPASDPPNAFSSFD